MEELDIQLEQVRLAAAGVGFAVVLMFMQIGFKNALIDNNVQVFTLLDSKRANISVISRARYSLATEQRFPKTLLEQLAAQADATVVGTVNIERGYSMIQVAGAPAQPIRVIALDPGAIELLDSDQLRQDLQTADQIDSCLVDTESKSFYGFATTEEELKQQSIELNSKSIQAAGYFRLGTDFSNDGTLLMSQRVHAGHYPWRSPTRKPNDMVDIGVLSVQPTEGKSLADIAREMQAVADKQAIVLPTAQLVGREKKFWSDATPIGKIFSIGTLMGLIVGAIICYQIQFTDIADHMPEFATLKAMGYSGGYFWKLVLTQSFYLACLGFLPGIIVSYLLYQGLANYSGLIMMMTWYRVGLVWILTLIMCCISGALAIRKLFNSDPASLF